jgi:hypothetical protein
VSTYSLRGIGWIILNLLALKKVGAFIDYVEQLAQMDVKLDLHLLIELLKQVSAVVDLTDCQSFGTVQRTGYML